MSDSVFLKIDGVTRRFGGLTAVNNVSLELKHGEKYALLGPNGAGKTTLIKMITGTLVPHSGTTSLNGHDSFKERDVCMGITGYVPDDPTFPQYARAAELINFYGEMHGMSLREIRESAELLIKRLKLDEDMTKFAVDFSKGMKKKFAFLLALLHNPSFLVFDELTNGLDPFSTRELHAIIEEKAEQGCLVLFSTHLLDQAEKNCDHIAIMNKGEIVISGGLNEVRKKKRLEEIFFKYTGNAAEYADGTFDCSVVNEEKG